MVGELFLHDRARLTEEERDLAIHLRGNERLHNALSNLVRSRIRGRETLPVPSDPMLCKSLLERNTELRWFLGRLERLYQSPANEGADNDRGEQPAA